VFQLFISSIDPESRTRHIS